MSWNIDEVSLRKKRLSLEYYLRKLGLNAFAWRKASEYTTEETVYTEEKHHDTEYAEFDIEDKRTGLRVGTVTGKRNVEWTERKEEKVKVKWDKYVRVTPYTDKPSIKKCEKTYKFFEKIRSIIWVVVLALGYASLLMYICTMGARSDGDIFHQIFNMFTTVAIIYLVFVVLGILTAMRGKALLNRCNYRQKVKQHLKDRAAKLESDYKHDKIGYDSFVSNKKYLQGLIRYL